MKSFEVSFHLFTFFPFLEMNQVQRSATHILRIFWNIFSPSNFILVFVTDFFIGFYIFLCPSRGISLFNKCFTTAIYEMKELGTKGSTYMYRYIYRWSEDISILRRTSHKLFSTLILSTRHIHLAALFLLVHISKHHIGTHMTQTLHKCTFSRIPCCVLSYLSWNKNQIPNINKII